MLCLVLVLKNKYTDMLRSLFLFSILILFITTGCEKKNTMLTPPGSLANVAPEAFAGTDLSIVIPEDSVLLTGTYTDRNTEIVQPKWKKISGPFSHLIEKSGSLQTKVHNLEKGIYEFELTVTDKGGLTGKDTVTINVEGPRIPSSNEVIFGNLTWIFPWYASIEVKKISSYPDPQKVFIHRGFDTAWIEAGYISNNAGNQYEYFIEKRPDGGGIYTYGSLYIFYYGTRTNDNPQVKIQF